MVLIHHSRLQGGLLRGEASRCSQPLGESTDRTLTAAAAFLCHKRCSCPLPSEIVHSTQRVMHFLRVLPNPSEIHFGIWNKTELIPFHLHPIG